MLSLSAISYWLEVPSDTDDERTVHDFGSSYDGYALAGALSGHDVARDVRMLIDAPESTRASLHDLRLALFVLARFASVSGSAMLEHPSTVKLLRRVRAQAGSRLLVLAVDEKPFGKRPREYERAEWVTPCIKDLALLALTHLGDDFDPQQLSWLGLTSKPELAVRDRLGWTLQAVLPDHRVAREWKRSDLAVMSSEQVDVIIEGKALYGFDALRADNREAYAAKVSADIAKASQVAARERVLGTVLMVTPISMWEEAAAAAVAYSGRTQNQVTARGGRGALESARALMHDALRPLGQVGLVQLAEGEAFGSTVVTDVFVVQPR